MTNWQLLFVLILCVGSWCFGAVMGYRTGWDERGESNGEAPR